MLFDLGPGQSLEAAEAALAQRHLGAQRQPRALGQRTRRVGGALQVAGIDGVEPFIGQRTRQPPRLLAAGGIELDVDLALDARLRVPVGLAVAHGDDAGQRVVIQRSRRLFSV